MVNACYYHSERDAVGEETYLETGLTVSICKTCVDDMMNNDRADVDIKMFTQVDTTTGQKPADGANPEVDHPKHYNLHPSGVECIEIVRHMGFNLGNVVKYIWRDGIKDVEVELQDLEKAAWYLADEIARRKDVKTDG